MLQIYLFKQITTVFTLKMIENSLTNESMFSSYILSHLKKHSEIFEP